MTASERPSPRERGDSGPTVVAIGASAGGLAALRVFLSLVPNDSGLAFVVVVHLAPEHESHLADLLQPHAAMPVQQVTETTPLKAKHVYVIPPARNLDSVDTHLRLSELEASRRERAPIDHFFRTLAATHDGHAIGVILTGTGTDGTLGLREIKLKGGFTIVQDPAEAEFDGMPSSALATGIVDAALPLREIPARILSFVQTRPSLPIVEPGAPPDEASAILLQQLFSLVRARTGNDFSRYKLATIGRRIQRRMQLGQFEVLADYVAHLRDSATEARALSDDFLITVTGFFRDPHVFDRLGADILPELVSRKAATDPLRVWSVGCASGEEAYSLAMIMLEAVTDTAGARPIQVFASDLHEKSLAMAREGVYPAEIAADVGAQRLHRFFVKEAAGYRVKKFVRERVTFAPHNLLADPPFSRIDIVSCRNLLIYLKRDLQRDVVDLFHYALNPDGVMLLGSSETIEPSDLFHVEDKSLGFFRKRSVRSVQSRLPVFPFRRTPRTPASPVDKVSVAASLPTMHERLLELASPSLLLSPDYRVVHLSPSVGRFLSHPGGEPTASVFKLLSEELQIPLRLLLQEVFRAHAPRASAPVHVMLDQQPHSLVLRAVPATTPDEDGYTLLLFDAVPLVEEAQQPDDSADARALGARHLREELDVAQSQLASLFEEQNLREEEMRANNEELQSVNEELRSTLEELETSKEELQSINEELQTVNQENRHKVEELAQLSSDLHNLLTATDIATLFLDRQLHILRFTPQVASLFNVRISDRGRPLSDLTHRLGYGELEADARDVLRTLTPKERVVDDGDAGHHYLARVMPYRSPDERIEGVVMTFVDISRRVDAERALRASENQFRALVEVSAQIVWKTNAEGVVVEDSPSWRAFTGQSEAEWMEGKWLAAVHPNDRRAAEQRWRAAVRRAVPLISDLRIFHAPSQQYRWTTVRAVPIGEPTRGWIGMHVDIHAQRTAEESLRDLNRELEQRVETRSAQVRKLVSNLAMAEVAERGRISQVLHDDLQQLLYGVHLKLAMIRKALDRAATQDAVRLMDDADRWIEQAIGRTRQLTVELSPPILKTEGLADALQWLQRQMRELHEFDVTVEVVNDVKVEGDHARVILFQIVRELLFNVVKHAHVSEARVRLDVADDQLVMEVADEGVGFGDPDGGDPTSSGTGLASIGERLALLDGSLDLRSAPGKGTTAQARVPLAKLATSVPSLRVMQ